MTKHILILALFLTVFFSCFEIIAITYQGQKIKELERNILKLHETNEELRREQEKQARIIAQDLYIFANGFEMGK